MSNKEDKNVTAAPSISPKVSSRALFKVLGVLIMVGLLGYFAYDQLTRMMLTSSTHVEQKIQPMQMNVAELENITQSQQKSILALTDDVHQLKQTVINSQQNQLGNKDQWLAAEVRYLVKLADVNLQFRNSISQAIALLKLADQEIRDVTDPKFEEARKALAADIVDLQSSPQVDTTGIYMRLLALNGKVDQLPLMNKPTVTSTQNPVPHAEEEQVWWRKGLKQTWESLRTIVVVRYNQSGKVPLIPPDQQVYLYQNWHAVLLHAMSALMQGQSDIYRSSLQQAEAWTRAYGVADSTITQAFLSELTQLQAIDIHPATPKMSRSLQAVEALTVS